MPKPSMARVGQHGPPPTRATEWAELYDSGWTFDRIAASERRKVSADTVRRAVSKWWPEIIRASGPRGSLGASPIVRIAELERQVAQCGVLVKGMAEAWMTLEQRLARAEDALRATLDTTPNAHYRRDNEPHRRRKASNTRR